ncbi:MAG: DUF5615 family PIN-like protein [bacterium]
MKIKLLIDEDVHFALANAIRNRGYDALNIQEIDKKGITDAELFNEAVKLGRCIFTYNVRDFVIIHNNSFEEKNHTLELLFLSSFI